MKIIFITVIIPKWEIRQENIKTIYCKIQKLKYVVSQARGLLPKWLQIFVTEEAMMKVIEKNKFKMLEKFPMKTETYNQHNIVSIRNEEGLNLNKIYCLPHGKDLEYKKIENQIIDYNMSDYRTTVFVNFEYNNKNIL